MDNLEITTSHNIVVSVELATVMDRILAALLDIMILGIYAALMSFITSSNQTLSYLLIIPVLSFYHLLMEYLNNGQSLGKKVMNLKVVALGGDRPTLMSLVMRWMFRLIDVSVTVGTLGAIFISSTKKKQRLGDLLADTTVIKLKNDQTMFLGSIKNIMPDDYQITYPQVVRYTDKDMLFVKDAIARYSKAKSEDNKKIIIDLVLKVSKDLNIRKPPTEKITFLNTLLNDYIILTR